MNVMSTSNVILILFYCVQFLYSVVSVDFNSDLNDAWSHVDTSLTEWKEWEKLQVRSNECGTKRKDQSPIDLRETGVCKDRHKIFITVCPSDPICK